MSAIGIIAGQEIRLNLRNRWIMSFAVLFAVATLGLAYFGMLTAGYSGFQDFRRTTASIINLVVFLVPLYALLAGTFSLVSTREYFELLATQPVTRLQILAGKVTGLLGSLLTATLIGFGIPGIITALTVGPSGVFRYALVVLLAMLLMACFLSLALLVSILMKRRLAALGVALAIWLFFTLLYDLGIMASTLYLDSAVLRQVLVLGLLGNPVDMVRVLSLLCVGGTAVFGPAGAALVNMFSNPGTIALIFGIALLLWMVVPAGLAALIFRRQNIS